MDSSTTNQISIKEIKNLDTSKIKSFQLIDGSIIVINNSKSSQDEQNLSNQPRPLFTRVDRVESSQQQLQSNTSQQESDAKKCSRCHRIRQITTSSQNQNVQSCEGNASQPLNQTEDSQNYQYYEQNLNMEQNQVENPEQQQLKNFDGQIVNDMIKYQTQEGGEYYGEEALEQNQNDYGYEGQQNENYYMDQQAYGQNAEAVGMEQGEYYQQGPEIGYEQGYGLQQGYQDENAYQENHYQGYEQEQQGENLEIEQKQEEINTNMPKVTVEEIITMEVKEDDQKEQNEQQNEEEKEPNEEKHEEQNKENEEEKDINNENKEDNKEEAMNNIEHKEQEQQQENMYEGKIEQKEQHDEQQRDEKNEEMKQPQNQEQQENLNLEEDTQKQNEFKETEYKGDEEAEAEINQENLNKEKIPEKKEKKDIKGKKNKKDKKGNYPRPRVPISKIEYVEYILPKKKINPFPTLPVRFLLQEVKRKTEPRSYSHSNTYLPSFGRERFGFISLPRKPVPMFRPMPLGIHGIPPRPPQMSPMPPFDMLMNQGMRPMPSVSRRLPPGPMFGPRFPPRVQPRPFHFPPPPRPQPFYFPPRPQTGFDSYYNQTRRFYGGNEGLYSSGIHPYPHPYLYQRYAYPPSQRRFAELYKNYEPEETVNRTDYFVEKKKGLKKRQQEEQEDYEQGYDKGSYYTYSMGMPRRNRAARSVSSGRDIGRFAFNLGRTQPIRSMFKRVENRRFARTKKPRINTVNISQGTNDGAGSSSRTGVRRVYQFQN